MSISNIGEPVGISGAESSKLPLPTDFWSNPDLLKSISLLQRFTSIDIKKELDNPLETDKMPAQVLARLMYGLEPAMDCLINCFKTYISKFKDISAISHSYGNGCKLEIGQLGSDFGGYVAMLKESQGVETHILATYPEDRELDSMQLNGWVNEFEIYFAEIPKDSTPESDQERFTDDSFVRYYPFRPTTYNCGDEILDFAKYEISQYYDVLCSAIVATALMIDVPKELWAKSPVART